MAKVKVYISSSLIVRRECSPQMSGLFSFREMSDAADYEHVSDDSFKFRVKQDFDDLILHVGAGECENITIEVETSCDGGATYTNYWTGFFQLFGNFVNYDKCFVVADIEPLDGYECLNAALKNLYSTFVSGTITTAYGTAGTIEKKTCFGAEFWREDSGDPPPDIVLPDPKTDCLSSPSEWCLASNNVVITAQYDDPLHGQTMEYDQTTVWARETAVTDCVLGAPEAPLFGSGWAVLVDDCVGSNTATWWRCTEATVLAGDYTHTRLFGQWIQTAITATGCGLTIKSDFFNINTEGDAPVNSYYTYAANFLHDLLVAQKSDVKRKTGTNSATGESWKVKVGEILQDLKLLFNAEYVVEGSQLIIEHGTFFAGNVVEDFTSKSMYLEVDYSGNEDIKTELFLYVDELASEDFLAQPITYDCGKEVKTNRCSLFSCDLLYIEDEAHSNNIADVGFVLIATTIQNAKNVIIDNNDPLKWENLLENLHKTGRLYRSGELNGAQQTFESWKPYMKQKPFKYDICCNTFAPKTLKATFFGDGTVDNAKQNINTGRVELTLKY